MHNPYYQIVLKNNVGFLKFGIHTKFWNKIQKLSELEASKVTTHSHIKILKKSLEADNLYS